MYRQLRDKYYHLLFDLISHREVQHWVNRWAKAHHIQKPWMVETLLAKDRDQVLAAVGAELGPFVPMDYYSLLNGILMAYKSGRFDLPRLRDALDEMTQWDPLDDPDLVTLSLKVDYLLQSRLDGNCTDEEASAYLHEAFDACEEAILTRDASADEGPVGEIDLKS